MAYIEAAVNYILAGDIEKAKQCVQDYNKVNNALTETNSVLYQYLMRCPKENINNEMVIWLLENMPLIMRDGAYYESFVTEQTLIAKCNEKAIVNYSQKVRISIRAARQIINKGGSYDMLKSAYKSYLKADYHANSLIVEFLSALEEPDPKFKVYSYTKRVLITLAWQYGNNDNYFKLLPRETLDQILEDVDEPVYFHFLDFITRNWTLSDILLDFEKAETTRDPAIALFMPYLWKNCVRLGAEAQTASRFVKYICTTSSITIDPTGPVLRHWLKKVLMSDRFQNISNISVQNNWPITYYCLTTKSEEALSMLRLLIQLKMLHKETLLLFATSSLRNGFGLRYPTSWLAVSTGYLPTIKFLLDENLLPETIDGVVTNPTKLSDMYNSKPQVKQFITNYYKEKQNK